MTPRHRRPGSVRARWQGPILAALLAAGLSACAPDPKKELAVSGVETYWVIDSSVGATHYIAPAVRLHVTNVGQRTWRAIEASATFRRVGEPQTWGSGFSRVVEQGKALKPGETALVVMASDGRYYSPGTPDQMFEHKLFKDASVEVFLKLGGSAWVKVAEATVARRIGAKSVEEYAPPQPVEAPAVEKPKQTPPEPAKKQGSAPRPVDKQKQAPSQPTGK